MVADQPHVVIVGGGFGGLAVARGLRRAPVRITLVDRQNHHLFQPLLYEVATAALSPADIAAPIRRILAKQKNTSVLLGDVTDIDTTSQRVLLRDGELDYDWLVVATGARHSYFGNDQWSEHAPGLKTVDDALEIRRRFLLAFEAAEREADDDARRACLTFVIVGAGPTGVELAGTMVELARRGVPKDFRSIDTTTARVILVEAQDRVLSAFDEALSARALRDLLQMGVEVRLNSRVTDIDEDGVQLGLERIDAANVIWAAGVQASSLGASLGAPCDDQGRVKVEPDCSVPGHDNVFVVGDLAHLAKQDDAKDDDLVPGVAPAAKQMGQHVARIIRNDDRARLQRPAFRYNDKGMLATIGRARAVGMIGTRRLTGVFAWLVWALVHVMYLIGFGNRLVVMLRWAWAYLIFQRGARLITGRYDLHLRRSRQRGEQTDEDAASSAA